MGYLFGHYAGDRGQSERAIEALREFDKLFRDKSKLDLVRPPLLIRLPEIRSKLMASLAMGKYRFTIHDSSDLSKVFVFSGQSSGVNWRDSLARHCVVFENLIPATPRDLYPKVKPRVPKTHF